MKKFLTLIALAFPAFPLQAQFFLSSDGPIPIVPAEPANKERIELNEALSTAEHAVVCSVVWDRGLPEDGKHFRDIAFDQLRGFVSIARRDDFELPQYSILLTKHLITAIDAPTADIAVGEIFAEFRIGAELLVKDYNDAFDEVKVDEQFELMARRFDVEEIYRCDLLVELFDEIGSR